MRIDARKDLAQTSHGVVFDRLFVSLPVTNLLNADWSEPLHNEDLTAWRRDVGIEVCRDEDLENRASDVGRIIGCPVITFGGGEFVGIHPAQSEMREEARITGLERFQVFDRPAPAVLFADKILVGVERVGVGDHDRRPEFVMFRSAPGDGGNPHTLCLPVFDEDFVYRRAFEDMATAGH